MPYVVTAAWTASEGKEHVVRDSLRKLAPRSRREPGCRFSRPYHDWPSLGYFLSSKYEDEAAPSRHTRGQPMSRSRAWASQFRRWSTDRSLLRDL
jgi:quinol monooxygenase YgiN